ncbi:uncharacterized protein METZ01_LOCUS254616 [marine metagenome]|uniref:Uncharacterized protein n=1 Tax=marine metagenome TaxID=408172 RepID=A0A382IR85_9ZZZZ
MFHSTEEQILKEIRQGFNVVWRAETI